jgi:hypothetical protein
MMSNETVLETGHLSEAVAVDPMARDDLDDARPHTAIGCRLAVALFVWIGDEVARATGRRTVSDQLLGCELLEFRSLVELCAGSIPSDLGWRSYWASTDADEAALANLVRVFEDRRLFSAPVSR